MQKFLFTGTFDSGKTTLASEFEADPAICVVREVARDLLRSNPDLASAPMFNRLNFAEQIRREEESEKNKPSLIICDRGVLDILAYATVFGNPIDQEWIDAMRGRYNKTFYFNKADIPFIPSSQEEEELRNEVDFALQMWISRLGIPVVGIEGTVGERKRLTEGYVREGVIFSEGAVDFMERR